jgi:hypothetical protein
VINLSSGKVNQKEEVFSILKKNVGEEAHSDLRGCESGNTSCTGCHSQN